MNEFLVLIAIPYIFMLLVIIRTIINERNNQGKGE